MSNTAHPREIELARRLRSGDAQAFDEFARSIGSRLRKYSLMVCRQPDDADEVVQDTLFEAFRRFHDLRDPECVHAWFFRMARNACLMKRRRSVFAPACLMPLDAVEQTLEIADAACLPEAALLLRESNQKLAEAVEHLSGNLKMVVLLRYFEGLTTEETAQSLALDANQVKTRLYRARLELRKQLTAGAQLTSPPRIAA